MKRHPLPRTRRLTTLESVLSILRQIEKPLPDPFALNFCGMKIIEAPEYPVLQLSNNFQWCSDDFRADMNMWLLKTFGTRSLVPKGTAYILAGRYAIMRSEGIAKVINIT